MRITVTQLCTHLAVIGATSCSIERAGTGDTVALGDSAANDSSEPDTAVADAGVDTAPAEDTAAGDASTDVADVLLDGASDVPPTGSLAVTAGPIPHGTVIDLSAEGKAAWAHWGLTDATSFTHKAGVGASVLGDGPIASNGRWAAYWVGFSWGDGDPIASTANSQTGIFRYNSGDVLQFSGAALTTLRTLRVYVSTDRGTGYITFSLSDASAAPISQVLPVGGTPPSAGHNPQSVQVMYRAASAGARILVKLEKTNGVGTISLHAATLQ